MDSKLADSSQFIVHSKTKTVNREPSTVNRPGLSLIELITGIAIFGLVILLAASVYFAHFRIFSNQNTSIEVASQNKLALDEMTNQIREGESVVNICPNCGTDTTGDHVLILRLWPLNASQEPFDPGGSNYDYIIYKQSATDNTKLIKKIIVDPSSSRSSSEKILATDISSLQFSYDNADPAQASEITISLTTSGNSGSKTLTTTQTSKAVLRNK